MRWYPVRALRLPLLCCRPLMNSFVAWCMLRLSRYYVDHFLTAGSFIYVSQGEQQSRAPIDIHALVSGARPQAATALLQTIDEFICGLVHVAVESLLR